MPYRKVAQVKYLGENSALQRGEGLQKMNSFQECTPPMLVAMDNHLGNMCALARIHTHMHTHTPPSNKVGELIKYTQMLVVHFVKDSITKGSYNINIR